MPSSDLLLLAPWPWLQALQERLSMKVKIDQARELKEIHAMVGQIRRVVVVVALALVVAVVGGGLWLDSRLEAAVAESG